jgi:hypothetical protein
LLKQVLAAAARSHIEEQGILGKKPGCKKGFNVNEMKTLVNPQKT